MNQRPTHAPPNEEGSLPRWFAPWAMVALSIGLFGCPDPDGAGSKDDTDCDTDGDTDDSCSQGGDDTDDGSGEEPGFHADLTFSDGSTTSFTGTVTGEYDAEQWGFAIVGTPVTTTMAFGFDVGGGTGTFNISDNEGASPATYTDLSFGIDSSGFVSVSGTLTVTTWTESTRLGQPGALATGTFSVEMTNAPDPEDQPSNPLTLMADGTFRDMFLFLAD